MLRKKLLRRLQFKYDTVKTYNVSTICLAKLCALYWRLLSPVAICIGSHAMPTPIQAPLGTRLQEIPIPMSYRLQISPLELHKPLRHRLGHSSLISPVENVRLFVNHEIHEAHENVSRAPKSSFRVFGVFRGSNHHKVVHSRLRAAQVLISIVHNSYLLLFSAMPLASHPSHPDIPSDKSTSHHSQNIIL